MSGIPWSLSRVYLLDSLQNMHAHPSSRLVVPGRTHTETHAGRHTHLVSSSQENKSVPGFEKTLEMTTNPSLSK